MSEHRYTKEILELVLTDEVSSVLQEYIITLVRSGYFDKDTIDKSLGFGTGAVADLVYKTVTSPNGISNLFPSEDSEKIKALQKIDYFGIGLQKKIALIKEVRSAANWGLRESKEFIDHIHPELIKIEQKMKT